MTKDSKKEKKLVLLDAHAILHRAYHALPDFSSSKGEPTGALYGLITMLIKITNDLKPDYIAACFDLPDPTHRHVVYEAYKATRAKTDDALIAQLIRARSVFNAFGIPSYEAPSFEADDLLGTAAKQFEKEKKLHIVIASGDMDTLQLVDGKRVVVYTMRKGMNDIVLYDEDTVKERYGFGPDKIADYKGLRGDPSDNIKGVPGIGEKTATELITKFGSVEEIVKLAQKNPEKLKKNGIKPRIVDLLVGHAKDAEFSKMLATIRTDAPVEFTLPDAPWRLEDHAASIVALCEELEFRSLKERIRTLTKSVPNASDELLAAEEPREKIDPQELEETSTALWLLNSDIPAPGIDEILAYGNSSTFVDAKEKISSALAKTGKLKEVFENIEKPLIPIIHRMNADGVFLDIPYLQKLSKEYKKELGVIEARIHKAAGHPFNISSPKQLAGVLFDELKISLPRQKKTAGGARTTKEEELTKMLDLHPIVADILAYRELYKLLSTYVEKLPAQVASDGRLHAKFLPSSTTTGRMASKDPNLQNIPIKTEYGRRVRSAFRAAPGFVLVAIDYSQIELRIAAGLSGDKKLTKVFESGGDVHTEVAAQVFGVPPEKVDKEMRRKAKVINFGILYGMGVNALRANLGAGVSRDEAAEFLDAYFRRFTGLALWIERTKLDAARTGYTETLFGRRRYFSGFKSALPNLRAQAERMAVNAPMQGTQSDIIKIAMVRADQHIENSGLREKARLLLQVHDELVYEIEAGLAQKLAPELREIMESVVGAKDLHGVPVEAEISIGGTWGDMKRLPRTDV